jgi:hypothetical protein
MGWMVLVAVGGLLACTCAGPDDNGKDLTPYAGRFDVAEDFRLDDGTQCPDPPTDTFYNSVRIEIEKNKFGAFFYDRWGDLPGGEIHDDTNFLATRSELADRIEFIGEYEDEDNFKAIVNDIREGCTRTFDLVGTRALP